MSFHPSNEIVQMLTATNIFNPVLALLPLLAFLDSGCTPEDGSDVIPMQTTSGTPETTGDMPIPTTEGGAPESTDETSTGEASSGEATSGEASTSDTGDGSSTTTPGDAGCGDGILADDEECDNGYSENKLDKACLPTCVAARCGDGFLHTGIEECDLGDALNSYEYGGCILETCKWGPRCGDGDLDAPDEVCDPGDPNSQGDGTVVCETSCRFKGRMVFLSSQSYDGDFDDGDLVGLDGADKLCRDLAATFDKEHAANYVAWLSDADHSMVKRIAHGEEFTDTPYVLRSGVPIAASFEALIADGPSPGIDLTETYQSLVNVAVWTNTDDDGTRVSDFHHCDNWGSNSSGVSASVGKNRLPADSPKSDLDDWKEYGNWTHWQDKTCNFPYHIYCFEN